MKSIIYIYYTYIGIGENIRFFRFGVLFSENIEQNMEKKLIKPMSKNKTNVIFLFSPDVRHVVSDRQFSVDFAIAFISREYTSVNI